MTIRHEGTGEHITDNMAAGISMLRVNTMLYFADTCAMQQLVQQMCKQVYDTFLKLQTITIAKPSNIAQCMQMPKMGVHKATCNR